MIKAKQSERETKRLEGDIKKEQRHLHHTLKELDVGMFGKKKQDTNRIKKILSHLGSTRKRFESEKHLSKNLEEKDRIEREFVKKREQVMIICR